MNQKSAVHKSDSQIHLLPHIHSTDARPMGQSYLTLQQTCPLILQTEDQPYFPHAPTMMGPGWIISFIGFSPIWTWLQWFSKWLTEAYLTMENNVS